MDLKPEYRPNESADIVFSEHTWLQGAFLATIAYGMSVVLFSMTLYLLHKHKRSSNSRKHNFLIVFITVLFLLSTIYQATLQEWTQLSFIDWRNYPGGPSAFQDEMFSYPVDMGANATLVISNWLCDIINVWRCTVIYKGCKFPLWMVMGVPCAMYCCCIAFGTLWLKQVGTTSQSPWDTSGINFTLPYYSMSLALNILVTLMIVSRLMVYRHRIVSAMGSNHGSQYTSLAAMIVESAAIYSGFSLLFLIPFAIGHPLSQVFIQALSPTQNVATFLIVFRVAQGKGWSSEAANTFLVTGTQPGSSSKGGSDGSGHSGGAHAMSRIRFKSAVTSTSFMTTTHAEEEEDSAGGSTRLKPDLSRTESSDIFKTNNSVV